jgi:hypothetical protein
MVMKNNRVKINCEYCQKEFLARNWKNSPGKFCSQECQRKGRHRETKMVHAKCKTCGSEFSQPKWWKSLAKYCSIKCMSKLRGENMRAEKHFRWKGGKGRPGKEKRAIKQAKLFSGKCENCGSVENLHGHHKIKYSERPDLCDLIENIQVLCCRCHALEHPEMNFIVRPIVLKGVYLNCVVCKKEFYVSQYKKETSKYCSNLCRRSVQHNGFKRKCDICSKEYHVTRKNEKKSKYCSNPCRLKGTWIIRKNKEIENAIGKR